MFKNCDTQTELSELIDRMFLDLATEDEICVEYCIHMSSLIYGDFSYGYTRELFYNVCLDVILPRLEKKYGVSRVR